MANGNRGDLPQNGRQIPSFFGSINGPYQDIRFDARLRNDRDDFPPAVKPLK